MKHIDSIFQAVTPAGAPGCVVGVQRKAAVVFRGAYGLASLELAVPLTPRTRFRVASVSKQFTVTAVLMLAAQGRLSLDDEVHAHLPELAPLPQAVTLEHLMRNTSGLPDFLEMLRLGGVGLDAGIDRADMLRCIAGNRHLNFAPGSRFLYSNTNFLLLGLVVERIAGCSLGDFLQQHVFAPLGMRDTVLEVAHDKPLPGPGHALRARRPRRLAPRAARLRAWRRGWPGVLRRRPAAVDRGAGPRRARPAACGVAGATVQPDAADAGRRFALCARARTQPARRPALCRPWRAVARLPYRAAAPAR